MRKKIYVEPANVGNLMFRHMFAEHLRRRLANAVITGAGIPEWGLAYPNDRPQRPAAIEGPHLIDVPALLTRLDEPDCDGVVISCYAQRLEFFAQDRTYFANLFASTTPGAPTQPDELVINVRGGDILSGIHQDYVPLAFSHYRTLLKRTGLRPVFVGQLGGGFYSRMLRQSFPKARFISGGHWLDDFQTIRHARNIALSVSTFSWLAAWLSPTATRIYMPQLGLFNPRQRPDVDLCPFGDERYVFEPFPVTRYDGSRRMLQRIVEDPAQGRWRKLGRTLAVMLSSARSA